VSASVKSWVCGLFVAVVVGWFVTAVFLYALRGVLGLGRKPGATSAIRVPPSLTGVVERLVFAWLWKSRAPRPR
jgi:hypothetical protein